MIREATPEEVNAIANDPEVYGQLLLGAVHPQERLDYTDAMQTHTVTTLVEDGFVALFQWTSPGTYEVHIMALKSVRGKRAMEISRDMLAYMKERGAKRVWGQPSAYNKAAVAFVRRMGLWYQDTGYHPVVGDVQYFEKDL